MFEEYLKHLRQEPIDHRLTVKTECGVRAVILLTTDKIERTGCIPCLQAAGVQPTGPTPKRQTETPTGKEPEMSDTVAEAFCEEYVITWTEHGEDFTGWQHRDIFTRSNRMSRAGAISLFHQLDYDRLMIVTVFRDRSWIVHHEPTDGAQPTLGTREDEHRILDLIHQALDTSLERLAKQTWMDIVAVLAQAKQMSRLEPKPPEFPTHPDAAQEQ